MCHPKAALLSDKNSYLVTRRRKIVYQHPYISEFARYFGKPEFNIKVDQDTRLIVSMEVTRDAVCGCARFVAQKLIGTAVDDADVRAGLADHHYPCLASMGKDIDFGDTLMHVSGNILKDNVGLQVKPFKSIQYISPGTRNE